MNSFLNENTNSCIELDTKHDISLDNSYHANVNETIQQIPSNSNHLSIVVRQTFATWNNVIQHINAYAIEQGFATRLDHTEKSLSVTIRAEIVCRHAGIANSRTEYYVKYINLEHNYLMDTAMAVFDSGHRKLSNSENNQVLMLYNSRIPVLIIIRMLNKEYRRYIHNKDMYNSLNCQSRDHVKDLSEISQLLTPLPELIIMLERLSRHQFQCSQYQQYCLFRSTRQQCPEILKSVSTAISDFIYSLLLEQYNKAKAYDVQEQEENLIRVFNKDHKHTVYQNEKSSNVNYIGFRWVIKLNNTTNIMQLEEQPEQDDINDDNLSIDVLSSTAFEIPIN
ncbi:16063_t:CDS:2 [Cetraspora pellucida]|uniref:16063_t:CDS:1 n=1 Tax=Cetraspora pellucida TaxID=1433469 RepID=A0ACA9MXY4_9GLOM|nr:16063_t:CDS:2 [Cetraspora pellucida]